MFIILKIFFATSGIFQSVICQHVKVCQLASKTASFIISFPEFRTDFASVKRICLGKKYNISVKGEHTFLIVWIQVADTIYKQLTVKNVNSV